MTQPLVDTKPSCVSASGKKWVIRSYSEKNAMALSQRLGLPSVLSQILSARGHTVETAEAFLNPTLRNSLRDPSSLKDMEKAVERIARALEKSEKIAVFGDYDVDGATSSALLYRYFQALGIEITVYIPDRIDEGYGPNNAAFDELKKSGVKLVLTVDCGTTSFEPLQYAHDIGLDTIVIDHHVAEPKLPQTVALINPNRLDEPKTDFNQLAAVGVSFLVLVSLNRHLRLKGFFKQSKEPNLKTFLDLVALGTVCDVMPLQNLNRAFVTQGLKVLAKRRNLGLKVLGDIGGINDTPSAYHLGFILGPRINAGGRVGQAGLGSALLRTDNSVHATEMAQKLDEYNRLRKDIEQEVLEESLTQAERQTTPIVLVQGQGWHPGVIGIAAGRLKEKFNRPSLVVSLDEDGIGKGSGRSLPGFDLGSAVHAARQSGLLIAGGGHAMAAGFTVEKDKISAFLHFLCETYNKALPQDLQPQLDIDGVVNTRTLTADFLEKIDRLAPFGSGNPTPKFALTGLKIQHVDIVGTDHVRFVASQLDGERLNGIAFRASDSPVGDVLLNHKGRSICIAGSAKLDTWQGRQKIQFTVEDVSFHAEVIQSKT